MSFCLFVFLSFAGAIADETHYLLPKNITNSVTPQNCILLSHVKSTGIRRPGTFYKLLKLRSSSVLLTIFGFHVRKFRFSQGAVHYVGVSDAGAGKS